jgi:arsenate-mycothiol transferase
MAAALLRYHAGDRCEVDSAGLLPKPIHPLVKEVLGEVGLDASSLSPKPIGPILGKKSVGYAIILRGADETDAPRIFPFATRTMCWEVGDPARAADPTLAELRHVRDEIDAHVRKLVTTLDSDSRARSA